MRLELFDFKLPKDLIAQRPAKPRDHARLLVYHRPTGKITDDYFYNLGAHLRPASTLVVNDSKVEKCRLRIGGVEIFILSAGSPTRVQALVRPGKKFTSGKKVALGPLEVETVSVTKDGLRSLVLSLPWDDPSLEKYRLTPLPPYISQDESLSDDYQTVYAHELGSKAAPTAGLHFTERLIADLAKNHPFARLTLHVGLGTFAPVKVDDISKHTMHSEQFSLSEDSAEILNRAEHITAIGTTTARTLESLDRPFEATAGSTDIFIKPGYQFKNVDSLVTNFHLPKSTLLMLVAAMTGLPELQAIYAHAIKKKYRFYSFGDAMLVL